jgi:aldehyde dehydrogenase (NAD+)
MSATLTGKNFIAGRWQLANGERFESRSPARESEVLGVFPSSSAEEARTAIAAACEAFPAWRRFSRIHRAELFDNLACT